MIFGPEEVDVMVGSATGLTGEMKAVAESVSYTAGETLSCSSLSVPQPGLDWIDTAFEFNFK